MVEALDDFARSDVADTPLTTSRDRFAEQAYDLLTSDAAQEAFQIDDEPAEVRDRYGRIERRPVAACWPAGWSRPASPSSRSTTRGPGRSAGTPTSRTSR